MLRLRKRAVTPKKPEGEAQNARATHLDIKQAPQGAACG